MHAYVHIHTLSFHTLYVHTSTALLPVPAQELKAVLRLWYHECCRVFQDRLVNSEDRQWFEEKLQSKMADFGVKAEEVLGEGPLLYGDFMVPNSENKIYEEIMDQQKVGVVETRVCSVVMAACKYS